MADDIVIGFGKVFDHYLESGKPPAVPQDAEFGLDLEKAEAGFSRGLGAASHKYYKRVRIFIKGKAAWKYYYWDDKSRKAYIERMAKEVHVAHRDLQDAEAQHAIKSDFDKDHPELKAARKRLSELSTEYVIGLLEWEKPPAVKISARAEEAFQIATLKMYADGDEEPEDLVGEHIAITRCLEQAFTLIPAHVKEAFDGAFTEFNVVLQEEDKDAMRRGWAGVCRGSSKGSRLTLAYDASQLPVLKRFGPEMKGGLFPIEVAVHEMAHSVHNMIGCYGWDVKAPGWKGPVWSDWEAFLKNGGKREPGVTDYAETNSKERWAESFTAALMFPRQLAATAPLCYEFFRKFFGEEHMRPLHTDREEEVRLKRELEEANKVGDAKKAKSLMVELDKITGVLDMPADDGRLQWWKKKETQVQKLLRASKAPDYTGTLVAFDPPDILKTGDQGKEYDRFYEMNVGARSVFVRVGPSGDKDAEFSGWDPTTPARADIDVRPSEIKEIYDTEGHPLSQKAAWWYLHQDHLDDEHPEVSKVASLDVGPKAGENYNIVKRRMFHEMLSKITRDGLKLDGADEKTRKKLEKDALGPDAQLKTPVEINAQEFRLRSGTFAYGNIGMAGEKELQAYIAAPEGERRAHLEAFAKKQPYAERVSVKGEDGRFTKPQLLLEPNAAGGPPLPVMHTIRYVNENPDGTKTLIECARDKSGDPSRNGKYYIQSPLWRALLTPHGESIDTAEDLRERLRQAAAEKKKVWVSVRTDSTGGDSPHYLHVQVQFDGRGQPRLMGDEWKRKLGKAEPRIDDILTPGRMIDGVETERPRIRAEAIKLEKPPKKKARELPGVGDRLIMKVGGKEVGKVNDLEAVVRVVGIIPGKRKGEPPPMPQWNTIVDAEPLPGGLDEEDRQREYTKAEQKWVDQGLLPPWYSATDEQRRWVSRFLLPALGVWRKTPMAATQEEWPARYVFVGEVGGRAGGRTFVREADAVVPATREPIKAMRPKPLVGTPLVYLHQEVDPITGAGVGSELRMLLPQDKSLTIDAVTGTHGVRVGVDPLSKEKFVKVSLDGFAKLRERLGVISLTADAEKQLRDATQTLKDAIERQREQKHTLDLDEIDPATLAKRGIPLNTQLGDGSKFTLAQHQKELIQQAVDNDGRILGAHYMGTGKTVSAIVLAQIMMSLKDPADANKAHPKAPKRTLIVAPLNTVDQWREAAANFDGGASVVGAGSGDLPAATWAQMVKQGADTNKLVIVGPEYWVQHENELREHFDGLIVDEAHMGLANEKAERNKVLGRWNASMKMLGLFTGTPITKSPADLLEYIKTLSKGEVWGGWTRKEFEDYFLESSPVPEQLGTGIKGPKVFVKPSKRAELAAIVSRWTHIAMPKDVRGKTLPAVRIEETKHAHMTGIQAALYAMRMAALSEDERDRLAQSHKTLSEDELQGLDKETSREVRAAKAIANCPAFKPQSNEEWLSCFKMIPDQKGGLQKQRRTFTTLDPGQLMDKKLRGKASGHWPEIGEMVSEHEAGIYGAYLHSVLGVTNYSQMAGTVITPEQLERMKADGWPKKVANPEAGPTGIRCRGVDTPAPPDPELDQAMGFQRIYSSILKTKVETRDANGKKRMSFPKPEGAFLSACSQLGVDADTGSRYLTIKPDATIHHDSVTMNGVTVHEGDGWVSDQRGSLHLLYRNEDWDPVAKRPKSSGGFEKVKHHDYVEVKGIKLDPPDGLPPDELEEWTPPLLRYDETAGKKGNQVCVRRTDTDQPYWVNPANVTARVRSLLDPGMRAERQKADVSMVAGNAKAEELRAYVSKFHMSTAPGPEGARQMVLFANGILDGCRTMEATMRTMGFMDVNEALEGSPHYDPMDPRAKTGAPNGKYFVTFIGATYTGDRDLNVSIFQKKKDMLGRDTAESLFVWKTNNSRKWEVFPGDAEDHGIRVSNWTQEQRERINQQFGIKPPEAFITVDEGGAAVKKYFYGTPTSAKILRDIVLTGDPTKMADSGQAAAATAKVVALKKQYADLVRAGAVTTAPLTQRQTTVFNNTEMIVCSDAAQVGMNLGNSVEMVMYDTLGSPMQEWQRITRCARMLPPSVSADLMGRRITHISGLPGTGFTYAQLPTKENVEGFVPGAAQEVHESRQVWAKDGKVAIEYAPDPARPNALEVTWVDRTAITEDDGPFAKIRRMEGDLFAAREKGVKAGMALGFKLSADFAHGTGSTFETASDVTLNEALRAVENTARSQAAFSGKDYAAWNAIANKAAVAANLGQNQAVAFLDEMKGTRVPGGTGNVLELDRVQLPRATDAGTWSDVEIAEPTAAIQRAIDQLPEDDRQVIAKAGFLASSKGGSLDPAGIYLAMRAADIFDYVEKRRPEVSAQMRTTSAGQVVTDSDVMNAIIDELAPEDRAILKHKKYLVNVRRIGVSASVPQMHTYTEEDENGEKVKRRVFVGYEKEYPIAPEAATRAVQRARMTSNEALIRAIQEKERVETDLDYETTSAHEIGSMSRLDVQKALGGLWIGLPLGKSTGGEVWPT